ncbi:LOW QUALITY PROTEIN: heat shock factor protein 3-like [Elgaria multicarinata webbii]|uniref:LOW QUALITY PROTEIN: heat shock factor protein 3-like n=1 Tax=Elgaria multicarinata webbii TaxID=159646 RepID=UPI002FCCCB9B
MEKAVAGVAAAVATAGPGASPVPGFLAKLWALVEDSGSDDVIAWSRNGQNFCILNEQRFAKELLPKYFKHSNLSSFIRQLNIYGFRKVIALENGMMTSNKSSAIEFQHPFFKRGKANLLASIKRKVSAVRSEDLKVCPEDLHKVLSEVQEMRDQQNSMDLKLASMKRENQALWKEVAFLRQKHNQQQQLLSKIFGFILGLMRGNCIPGLKRKRPLTDASGASPSKYSRPCVCIPMEGCEAEAISEHSTDCEDSIIIRDITDAQEEEEEDGGTEKLLALAHASNRNREAQALTREDIPPCGLLHISELELPESDCPDQLTDAPCKTDVVQPNAVELHSAQVIAHEDRAEVIDSILNENQTVAQSESLLEREEIQDFLNCIDASLEELQAMLSGKKFNYASDTFTETEDLPESADAIGMNEGETSGKNDMQLLQYRGNPLLAFFEEPPSNEDACKTEDAQDVLLPSLENRPPMSLPLSSESPQQALDPENQADGTFTFEPLDQPLLSEDTNREYKLFPLLLLSPVANFIEEASEIKHPKPYKGVWETAS